MPALARNHITDSLTHAANDDCINGGSCTRTKYSYDAAGNTVAYGSLGFSYNNRGRAATTTGGSTDYLYNALGQMIEKSGTAGTTIFMQDEAGHLLGEYDGSGNLVEETIWLGDIPVATMQPNGSGGVNIFYVHTDHLNTPRKVAQPSTGTLAWRWDADPFGTATPDQNPAGLGTFAYNLRLPGQYYMAETGLNQNVARDLDPQTGRYIESDPAGLDSGVGTYTYVYNNPLRWVDVTGKTPGSPSNTMQLPSKCAASLPPGSKGPIKAVACADIKDCQDKCGCKLDVSLALCGPNFRCILDAKAAAERCLLGC
jgi:RHS repeat-associated protein